MKIWDNIWRANKMVLVMINLEDSTRYHASIVDIRKVSDTPRFSEFDSLEDVVAFYKRRNPFHLHFYGAGVLNRKLLAQGNYKEAVIVGGAIDDFIITECITEQYSYVSLFRKAILNPFFEELTIKKCSVFGITSGYVPMLVNEGAFVFSGEYYVRKSENEEIEFTKNSLEKLSNRGYFKDQFFKLISNGVSNNYLLNEQRLLTSELPFQKLNKEEFINLKKFKTLGVLNMLLIFSFVFGNYFYQNNLLSDIAEREQNLLISTESLSLLDRLSDEKARKEQLIVEAGINNSRYISQFLDELAESVPSKITLDKLSIFPLQNAMKEKQKIQIEKNLIYVQGSATNNKIMDDWIEKINFLEWSESVELMAFKVSEQEVSEFTLLIKVKQ